MNCKFILFKLNNFYHTNLQKMEKSKFREIGAHSLEFYESLAGLPIKNDQRKCTDVFCIVVGLALTIILGVFAIATFNKPQYLKQVFPADTDGMTCGYEHPGYNYLYFAKPNYMQNRVCVKSCPTSGDSPLECKQNSKVSCGFGSSVQYYENDAVNNEYGMFCLPKDEGMRKSLMDQMESYKKDLYYNSVNTSGKCLGFVAIASVIYMLLVQCMPRIMNRVSVVLGVLALIAFTITIILYPSNIAPFFRWIIFGLALLFVFMLILTFVRYFSVWGLNGVFLDLATTFALDRLYVFLLPFLFLGFGVAFYFFSVLQYRSFWSFGELKFDPAVDLYQHIKNPTKNLILTIFQVIQLIWGTVFLKESFNYLISAEAVQWYYQRPSAFGNAVFTLVCKHLGSVIAAAFMNSFFGIFDFLFDSIFPTLRDDNDCYYCINRFTGFFDLARSDALALVYLTGNPYCNSARYAEYIACKSKDTTTSQSVSRIYRLASHFALAGLITLVAFWIFGYTLKQEVAIPAMFILLLISMGIATFFVSFHADAAQAIEILYLMDEQFSVRRLGNPTHRYRSVDAEVTEYLGSRIQKESIN